MGSDKVDEEVEFLKVEVDRERAIRTDIAEFYPRSGEEEELVERRRAFENFEEALQPIQARHPEYAAALAKGKVDIPEGYDGVVEFSIRDMGHMICYYLNRLNYEPDTLQVFYRPENDVLPWVKRGVKRNKNWPYLTFRTCLRLVALELTSLILGKQLDICLTMETSGDGRHRFRDFEATKLWRWATPYNYMFLQWEDCQTRISAIKDLLDTNLEAENKFWEYTNNIIHRYLTRKNCL